MLHTCENNGPSLRQREAAAYRRARAFGMKLSKARTRDARCVSYGQYMLIDRATNVVIDGAWPCDFSLTLEDVEARFDD